MIVHAIIFGVLCVALFSLPLLPSLLEWRNQRDAAPLKVVRAYDGNIKHFANSFRQFLARQFPSLETGAASTAAPAPAPLDGASFQLLAAGAPVRFGALELANAACTRMLVGVGELALGQAMLYEKEVYAGAGLLGGDRNTFRAILARGDIRLGDDCAVLRWAHSDASLVLGQRARLYGRVSAENEISLQRGTRFGRMAAPLIRFGATPAAVPGAAAPARPPLALPADLLDQSELRWLVSGPLAVPAGAGHRGDLVSRKHVSVGDGASVDGNLKSNGNMIIGDDVSIDGALVAAGRLQIGERCFIKGPVVCDELVVIGSGSVIGRPHQPTTVTAAEIRVAEGVLAHGTVWARAVGVVLAAAPAP